MNLTPAQAIERELLARPAPALWGSSYPGEFVWPWYEGRSLVNVPATVARLLGAELPLAAPPLEARYWQHLGAPRQVLLILLDALGYRQLVRLLAERPDSPWRRLLDAGTFLPMTSIAPSTTNTALSCLLTGVEPIAHGLLGYELWLREYGVLAEMLAFKPAYGLGHETLLQWGLQPEAFLPVASLGAQLAQAGIECVGVSPTQYAKSPLTRATYRGFGRYAGYSSVPELWLRSAQALESPGNARRLVFAYWGGIDAAIHEHGTADGLWAAQFDLATHTLERYLFKRLTPQQRRDTLLVLCADHGFIDTPADQAHDTEADPPLQRELLGPYSGESRLSYLHTLDGPAARVRVQQALGDDYVVLETARAVEAGLFGRAAPAPESLARLGHLVVLSRGQHYLDRQNKRARLRGRHGGLSPEEMLIPWLAAPLSAL